MAPNPLLLLVHVYSCLRLYSAIFHNVLAVLSTLVITIHTQKQLQLELGREKPFFSVRHGIPCDQKARLHVFNTGSQMSVSTYANCIVGSLLRSRLAAFSIIVKGDPQPSSDSFKDLSTPTTSCIFNTFNEAFCPSSIFRTPDSKWTSCTMRAFEPRWSLKLGYFSIAASKYARAVQMVVSAC